MRPQSDIVEWHLNEMLSSYHLFVCVLYIKQRKSSDGCLICSAWCGQWFASCDDWGRDRFDVVVRELLKGPWSEETWASYGTVATVEAPPKQLTVARPTEGTIYQYLPVSTSIMCLFAVFWLSGDTIVLFIYQMQLLTSLFFSPTSSGPGQVGPVDRWAKDCSPHMQRYAVQWDHRAHWEHGTLRGTDGAPHQAHYFHQSYWQECLHWSESPAAYSFNNVWKALRGFALSRKEC